MKKTRLRSPGASEAIRRRQLDRPRVGVAPQRVEVELLDLARRRLPQLGAAVAGVDAEEAGEAVEVAVAVLVVDVAALAADDDRDLVVGPVGAHAREVHPEMALGQLLKAGVDSSAGCDAVAMTISSPATTVWITLDPGWPVCKWSLGQAPESVLYRTYKLQCWLLGHSPLASLRHGRNVAAVAAESRRRIDKEEIAWRALRSRAPRPRCGRAPGGRQGAEDRRARVPLQPGDRRRLDGARLQPRRDPGLRRRRRRHGPARPGGDDRLLHPDAADRGGLQLHEQGRPRLRHQLHLGDAGDGAAPGLADRLGDRRRRHRRDGDPRLHRRHATPSCCSASTPRRPTCSTSASRRRCGSP